MQYGYFPKIPLKATYLGMPTNFTLTRTMKSTNLITKSIIKYLGTLGLLHFKISWSFGYSRRIHGDIILPNKEISTREGKEMMKEMGALRFSHHWGRKRMNKRQERESSHENEKRKKGGGGGSRMVIDEGDGNFEVRSSLGMKRVNKSQEGDSSRENEKRGGGGGFTCGGRWGRL